MFFLSLLINLSRVDVHMEFKRDRLPNENISNAWHNRNYPFEWNKYVGFNAARLRIFSNIFGYTNF